MYSCSNRVISLYIINDMQYIEEKTADLQIKFDPLFFQNTGWAKPG